MPKMVEYADFIFPMLDRMLIISWLLKDCGWMITNMYMGFPFGIISVLLHALLLFSDTRRSFGFYNVSLFLWVCGNFIWMTIEFTDINPSSDVHLGPQVPTGGISDHSIYVMTQTKTVMFLIGVLVQIAFYICIFTKRIPMPEQADEDIIIRNEATLFLLGQRSYTATSDVDSILDLDEESPDYHDMDVFHARGEGSPQITLAFIESGYIIFWIFKDLFWSFGTGDLNTEFGSVVVYEILAMIFGFTALCVYLVTAYIYRRKTLRFLDSLTTIFWISANYVWMCGEFFIRYNSLQFDDADPGNDRNTRIASATLFCAGMLTQVYVVIVLYMRYRQKLQGGSNAGNYSVANGGVPKIDLFGLKGIVQYQTIMTGFSPQHQPERVAGSNNRQHLVTEEEDTTVLF